MAKKIKTQEEKTTKAPKKDSKPKSTKAKKQTLIEMQQMDGKLYSKYGHKSLDEILGIDVSKYKTHDVAEYEQMLNNMNVSDLQRHAASVQVMPREDRRLLIQLLVKQFKINNSLILNPAQQITLNGKEMTQEALDVLAEGR